MQQGGDDIVWPDDPDWMADWPMGAGLPTAERLTPLPGVVHHVESKQGPSRHEAEAEEFVKHQQEHQQSRAAAASARTATAARPHIPRHVRRGAPALAPSAQRRPNTNAPADPEALMPQCPPVSCCPSGGTWTAPLELQVLLPAYFANAEQLKITFTRDQSEPTDLRGETYYGGGLQLQEGRCATAFDVHVPSSSFRRPLH